MLLNKIPTINAASFNNYSWPSTLQEFKDINIVLGWNGSGKTIISRLLRSFEKGEFSKLQADDTFSISLDGIVKKENELSGHEEKIRVFNEDYVKEITTVSQLPYVFYLGEESVDYSVKEKEISDLESKLKKCPDNHSSIAENTAQLIRRTSGMGNIQKELESGFYDSYNKNSFEKRFGKIQESINSNQQTIDDFRIDDEEELQSLLNQLTQQVNREREYKKVKKWDEWLVNNIDQINLILQSIPTHEPSQRILDYKEDYKKYSWIREGVEVHNLTDEEHQQKTCIFCNSHINNRNELIKHFSDDIIKLNKDIDEISEKIDVAITELSTESDFYSDIKTNVVGKLKEIKEKLTNKKESPINLIENQNFESIVGDEPNEGDIKTTAHKIEAHYVAEVYEKYKNAKEAYEECAKEQAALHENIKDSKRELGELKARAKNIHEPAQKLNALLHITFPYKQIELQDSEDGIGYELTRNGTACPFATLSEGERNFIALAYFLISLNTEDEAQKFAENGIVVIDDPVSSLDKNSIFQIFSIIAGEIETRAQRQYLLFTHNLDFYSHLHDHFKSSIDSGDIPLYQAHFNENGSSIGDIHPMLKKFKSDYQYTVSLLWDKKDNCSLDDAYLVVNLLRRAWETFLHFKFSSTGDIKSMLDKAYAEAVIEKQKSMHGAPQARLDRIAEEFKQNSLAMYRFVNYGSHKFNDVDTIDESILYEASKRISDFFYVVNLIDKHHHQKITNTGS